MSSSSEQRLKRLRELIGQLERLPPSAERERMLREVRARAVDIDTGEQPSAMRPAALDPLERVLGYESRRARAIPPREQPTPPVREAPTEPVPVDETPVTATDDWLPDDVLSLDDSSSLAVGAGSWRRGLRG
jgi:hypothetical protein